MGQGRLGRDGAGSGRREAAGRGLSGPPGSAGAVHLLLTSSSGLARPPSFSPPAVPLQRATLSGQAGRPCCPFQRARVGGPRPLPVRWGGGWAWCWCLRLLPDPQARGDAAMTHTHIQTPRDTPAEPGCPDVPRGPTITQAHADTPHRPAHTQHSIRLTLCRDTPALRRGSGQAPVAMGRPGSPHPLQPGGPCPHQARPRPAPTGQRPCSWLAVVS